MANIILEPPPIRIPVTNGQPIFIREWARWFMDLWGSVKDINDITNNNHPRRHYITSNLDHRSDSLEGKLQKADSNGLPIDSIIFEDYDPTGALQTKIGIHTTTPGAKLEINGNLKIDTIDSLSTSKYTVLVSDLGIVKSVSDIQFSKLHNRLHSIESIDDHTSAIDEHYHYVADSNGLFSQSTMYEIGGNIGIGEGATPPSAKLDIDGTLRIATVGNVPIGSVYILVHDPSTQFVYKTISPVDLTKIHDRQHSLQSTSDHTSTSTQNYLMKSDSSGLPVNSIAYDNGSCIGIGVTLPTAILHLKAGTATAGTAPLKFNTGVLLSSIENGSMEFDNEWYYLTFHQIGIDPPSDTVVRKKIVTEDWIASNLLKGSLTPFYIPCQSNTQYVLMDSILYYDSSNKFIGINSSSPGTYLEVKPVSGNSPVIRLKSDSREEWFDLKAYGGSGHITDLRVINGTTTYANFYDTGLALGSYAGVNNPPTGGLICSGNCGVGLYDPIYKLQVKSSGTTSQNDFRVSRSDGKSMFELCTDSSGAAYVYMAPSTGSPNICLNTGGDSYFNGGNVGIGTAVPLSKLDISGSTAIGTYAGTSVAPTNGLIVSGNVGIGTSAPVGQLEIYDDTSAGKLYLSKDSGTYRGCIIFGRHNSGSFQTTTQIETYSDSASVNNGVFRIFLSNNSGTLTEYLRFRGNNGGLSLGSTYIGTAAPANGMIIEGNVGIGTSSIISGTKFNVSGAAVATYYAFSDSNGWTTYLSSPADGGIRLTSKSSSVIDVKSTLMVGIGTTSQTSTLHLGGSFALPIVTKTSTYTATSSDFTIITNAEGTIDIDLPQASTCPGRVYIIINEGDPMNVDPYSGDTVDTYDPYGLAGGDKIIIQSDGVNMWHIINYYNGAS